VAASSPANQQSAIENHIDALWIEFGDRLGAQVGKLL
jgi:hypothetical protein